MITGLVSSVSSTPLGTSLVANHAAGVGVLSVDFSADFDEDGGLLLLNGATLAYTTVTSVVDGGAYDTIVLAAPLAVAASDSDPVSVVEGGQAAVEWHATIDTEDGDSVPALIPTALVRYFSEDTYGEDVYASAEGSGDGYVVTTQPSRTPSLDGAVVWNPYVSAVMDVASIANVADSTWTQVSAWTNETLQGMTLDSAASTSYPGRYMAMARVTWPFNATGRRGIRIKVDGVTQETYISPADSGGQTFVPVADQVTLLEDSQVTVEVFQDSGSSVAIFSGQVTAFRISI